MFAPLSTLTELEAVNRILSTVGGEKLAVLDDNISFMADAAYDTLRDSLRDLQSHPWGFNTQYDVELEADGHGQIAFDTENLAAGGPSDFTGWTISVNNDTGKDGMPGPLGYGHAYHWGNYATTSVPYMYQNVTVADEQYYTCSVYLKYHSALSTQVYLYDAIEPTHETNSQLRIIWNTDGTIASSTSIGSPLGEEDETGDSTTPPLAATTYTAVGSKGWYRVVLTAKVETGHGPKLQFQVQPNWESGTYGSTYVWGPQIVKSAYVAPYEQGMYDSKYIAAIDLAPQNAGSLDVVLRTNQFQTNSSVASDAPMLFDRKSNSFNAFSGTYKATITYYLQYEDCPEAVKVYATAAAAVNFQATQVGNAQIDQILRAQLATAKSAFESYEAAQESWSIWEHSDFAKIVSGSQRPQWGNR